MATFFTSNTQFLTIHPHGSDDLNKSIECWNSQVAKVDIVYVIGNFISTQNRDEFIDVVDRLNGTIKLIYGPRDQRYDLSELIKETEDLLRRKLSVIGPYYTLSGDNAGTMDKVILSFWPLLRWEMQEHGSWHLHGGKPTKTHRDLTSPGSSRRICADWYENGLRFIKADIDGQLVVNS